jgi:arsenate reductase (thioredoxin)
MIRVLFLCQKNNILSQIAEGLVNKLADGRIQAFSAGVETSPVPELVKAKMLRMGIDAEFQYSKSFEEFKDEVFDYVLWIGSELDKGLAVARQIWPECQVWHAETPDPALHTADRFLRKLELQTHFISAHVQLFILSHHQYWKYSRMAI